MEKKEALTMGALSGEMEALGMVLRKALSARTVGPPTLKISGASLGFADFLSSSTIRPVNQPRVTNSRFAAYEGLSLGFLGAGR